MPIEDKSGINFDKIPWDATLKDIMYGILADFASGRIEIRMSKIKKVSYLVIKIAE